MTEVIEGDCKDGRGDRFRWRMEAQCRRIREYRREVICNEGRQLSCDEAALEWIERHAESFARDYDSA